MITNNTKNAFKSSGKLPGWTTFPIKKFDQGFRLSKSFEMLNTLFVIAHDLSSNPNDQNSSEESESATLFAVDLWNYAVVQQTKIDIFAYHEDYNLVEHRCNKIIKFCGRKGDKKLGDLTMITIESVTPLSIKCEEIKFEGDGPKGGGHTAVCSGRYLYVYCGETKDSSIWKFDLLQNQFTKDEAKRQKKKVWKLIKPKGQGPGLLENPKSFLDEHNIYIYGGGSNPDIFMFPLLSETETWKKVKHQANLGKQIDFQRRLNFDGQIYKGNFLTLGQKESHDELYCWNIEKNAWSTFEVQTGGFSPEQGSLTAFQDLLLATVSIQGQLSIFMLNLGHIVGLPIPESPEQKRLRLMFMNEKGSDIKLQVQDRIIPAHKKVLIDKSFYFDRLFENGQPESKQKVIEINNCEYDVFKEYLRCIYYDKAELDEHLAMKLMTVTDKYFRSDFNQKWLDYLMYNINSENVYTILDFALEYGHIPNVVSWCLRFFEGNIGIDKISGLLKYIDRQTNPEFKKQIDELRNKAAGIITEEYMRISKEMKTDFEQQSPTNIRRIVFGTVQESFEKIKENILTNGVSESFWENLNSEVTTSFHKSHLEPCKIPIENVKNSENEETKENKGARCTRRSSPEVKETRGRKRKEPAKKDETLEEKPELKKTKKTSALKNKK